MNKKLATTAPFLGGVTVSNIVTPVSTNGNTIAMQQPIVDIGFSAYKNFATPHPILIKTGIRFQGLFLSGVQNISSKGFQSVTVPLLLNYSITTHEIDAWAN